MLEVWCELVCNTCAKTSPGQHSFGPQVPRINLKRTAEAHGWKFDGDSPYCSQTCLDRAAELKGE